MLFGYLIPVLLQAFHFHDNLYTSLDTFQIALAFTWSIKMVIHMANFCIHYIQIYENIVSFAKLNNFSKKAKIEKKGKEELTPELIRTQKVCLLKNVSLSLGKRLLINNISLELPKGKIIGLLGESGSGKHILVDLLLKIYTPDLPPEAKKSASFSDIGAILPPPLLEIFGLGWESTCNKSFRKNVVFLKSEPTLFSGTLRDNIDPDKEFSDDEINWCMTTLKALRVWNLETEKSNHYTSDKNETKDK